MNNKPNCLCHDDIDQAIKDHAWVVYEAFHKLKKGLRPQDRIELISDGYEALWRGLEAYDPSKMPKVNGYLITVISQKMIDGIRRDHGRHSSVRMKKSLVQDTYPLTDAHDAATDFEWNPESIRFTQGEIEIILASARRIDPALPQILFYRSEGFLWKEVAQMVGKTEGQMLAWMGKLRAGLLASSVIG